MIEGGDGMETVVITEQKTDEKMEKITREIKRLYYAASYLEQWSSKVLERLMIDSDVRVIVTINFEDNAAIEITVVDGIVVVDRKKVNGINEGIATIKEAIRKIMLDSPVVKVYVQYYRKLYEQLANSNDTPKWMRELINDLINNNI